MAFDVKGALAEGYSPTEIADYLGKSNKFDVVGARNEGYTDNEIIDHLTKKKTAGVGEALVGSTKRLVSSARTALEAPFGGEEAALKGLERQQAITQRPGASLEEVKRVYEQEGLFPAAKEAISQIPSAIAEQAPILGTMAAGYRTGFAATPAVLPYVGPFAKPIGGALGAAVAPFLTQTGQNVERQATEQIAQGKPLDINVAGAYGAAVPQTALDVVSLKLGLGRLLGVGEKAMGTVAAESKLRAALKGTGKAAIAELPTEVTQQMLERYQAGLPLTNDDAIKEYYDVGYQAALMSPLGGAARVMEAGEARGREDQLIKAEQQRMAGLQAEGVKTRLEAEKAYARATAEQKALIEAQIKSEPNKSLIDIINEVNKVTPSEPITTPKNVLAALNEPSGVRVADPETGIERELTMGEVQMMRQPELAEPVEPTILDKTTLTSLVPTLTPQAGVYKRLLNQDINTEEQLTKLHKELNKLGDKHAVNEEKLKEIEDAYKQKIEREVAQRNIIEPQREELGAGIPVTGERLGDTSAARVAGTELGGMAPTRELIREPADRTSGVSAPLIDARNFAKSLSKKGFALPADAFGLEKAYNYTNPNGVEVTLKDFDAPEGNGILVDFIGSKKRGKGLASKELDRIIAQADKTNTPLGLRVDAEEAIRDTKDVAGLSDEQLKQWYERKGFIFQRGSRFGYRPAPSEDRTKYVERTVNIPKQEIARIQTELNTDDSRSYSDMESFKQLAAEGEIKPGYHIIPTYDAITDTSGQDVYYFDGASTPVRVNNVDASYDYKKYAYTVKPIQKPEIDINKEARQVAAELRALDPEHPMIEGLKDELNVTPEEVEAGRQEVQALKASREEATTEALPTVDERALEPDVDEEGFRQATDLLGAYVRQKIGGVQNITPEEQISTAQAMTALADIMYYIVKKGVKSAGHAISRARRALGENAKHVTPEQFQAAYDSAVTRVKETPPEAPYVAPEGDLFDQTAEFMPPEVGKQDSVVDMVKNFDRSVINTENVNNFVNKARINVVYSGAGVADELTKAYEGAVSNALTKEVRADILMSQALSSNKIAAEAAMDGKVVFDDNGVARVVDDTNNLKNVFAQLASLGEKIGADKARHAAQAYMVGQRYQSWLELNAEKDKAIAVAKAQGKRAVVQKLERQKKYVSEAQEAAIPAALQFGEIYPEVKEIAAIYEATKNNEIDMLEQAGYYSKELADEYRATKGYVPLYRIMDDIEEAAPGAKQYFRGFADIGAEKKATGSERQVDDVFDNMMTRHMWAVNAAVRNRANRAVANQLGIVNNDGVLIVTDKVQPGAEENSAPVWINGERKYVQYSDPTFAQGIQGLEPALGPFMSILAGASKIMRMGVTMLPPFQLAMVFHDAPRAALNSGVNNPFQLMGKVVTSFAQILKDPNDPFVVEMRKLGITGGYGHNAKEVASKLRRDLGLEANSLTQKALDKAEVFAAASDLAQRRAIYMQTMQETNNPVLAMHRALDIINFQKHGRSAKVRAMTQVVPFMNAYLQGMDVLYQAMSGKGISGKQKRQAQVLFLQTAIKLAALSAIYSMMVADDDDYKKLDDRQKLRSLIIPGTGIKIPVAADVAMLVKAIPELGYQYIVREGTNNPMDASKLFSGISQAFVDGLTGPNLMPQALRAGFEVAVNKDFMTGNPIVGRGLENLATEEQFTENTSRLARLIGQTGLISPMNADHLIRGYGGTAASLFMYSTDALVNQVADVKTPTVPVYKIPSINAFMYSTQGKGQLNDYYDLKDKSDEVTATLHNKMKYGTAEEVRAYREENKEMLAARGRVNAMSNQMKTLREQRKRVIASDLSADAKRERLDEIDNRIANVVKNIGAIRVKAGL